MRTTVNRRADLIRAITSTAAEAITDLDRMPADSIAAITGYDCHHTHEGIDIKLILTTKKEPA